LTAVAAQDDYQVHHGGEHQVQPVPAIVATDTTFPDSTPSQRAKHGYEDQHNDAAAVINPDRHAAGQVQYVSVPLKKMQ
jgi:hypothetical protein